jgi:uncharacterized membrane protein
VVIEWVLLWVALIGALALKPWQQLVGGLRQTPFLASLVLLPWLWALPSLMQMPLQLQLSGACAVTLMLGWPLAIPVLVLAGVLSSLPPSVPFDLALARTVWLGIVPATFALGIGALLRRYTGEHPFVYILGRAFIGTALATFLAGGLGQAAGHELLVVGGGLSMVGRWLMAWGDGFLTGMLAALCVAFKPEWLATWSDQLYLKKP